MLTLLLDADLHAPERRGVVNMLLVGGVVAWIGTDRPSLDPVLDVEVRELDGATVVPGLVDGHVHVTGGGGEGGPTSSPAAPTVQSFTRHGVTTVVGLLGTDDVVRTPGQVLTRVRALRELGLRAWMLTGGYSLPPVTVTGDLRTDLVHLEPVLGVGEVALSDHRGSAPTSQELVQLATRVRTAAMLAGKHGTLHLHLGDGSDGLEPLRRAMAQADVPPGQFHPTHVNRSAVLLDDAIELARTTSVRIDVTAFPVDPSDPAVPAADAVLRALDAGVAIDRISVSSDAGGSLPRYDADGRLEGLAVAGSEGLLGTVRRLVDAGLSLEQALVPVTTSPGAQLGLDHLGRIGPAAGDHLVVLDEALSVRDVHAEGRWHVAGGEPVTRDRFSPPIHTTGPS